MTPITSELHLDTLDESSQGEQQQGVAGAQGAGQQGSTCASLSLSRLPATGELQTGVIDTALETIAEGGVEQQGSVTLHTAGSESHTAHGQNGRTAVRRDDHISSTTDDVDENAPLLSRDESSSVTARGGSQQGGTTGRTPTKSRGGGSGAGVRHTTTTQDSALSAQSVFNSKEAAALAAAEDTPLLGAADDNSSRLRSHSAGSRLPAVLQPLPSERRFAAMGDGVSLASTSAGGSAGSEEEARSPHTPRASVAGSLERPSVSTPAQASAGARGDGRVQTMTTQDSVPQASQVSRGAVGVLLLFSLRLWSMTMWCNGVCRVGLKQLLGVCGGQQRTLTGPTTTTLNTHTIITTRRMCITASQPQPSHLGWRA